MFAETPAKQGQKVEGEWDKSVEVGQKSGTSGLRKTAF
jgi:hypothetical protein